MGSAEIFVTKLQSLDRDQFFDLVESHGRILKTEKPPDYDEGLKKRWPSFFLKGSQKIFLGAFQDSRLIAVLGMHLWTAFPYWSLVDMKTRPELAKLGVTKNGLADLLRAMVHCALDLRLTKYYFLMAVRGRTLQNPLPMGALQKVVPELRMFEYCTESYIPANTRPRHAACWQLMGSRIHPVNMIVRSASLKESIRISNLDYITNLET